MGEKFTDYMSSCLINRRDYGKLFKIPSSYEFLRSEDEDKILFLFLGDLYISSLKDFSRGLENWKKISADDSRVLTR